MDSGDKPMDTGDKPCGHLSQTESCVTLRSNSDYVTIPKTELQHPQYLGCMEASHCMIFSRHNERIINRYDSRAAVLMQMRFDGNLGFPGGIVDEGEDRVKGLNRELVEEIHLDMEKYKVQEENYVVSHWDSKRKIALHFYALEVPIEDFKIIESQSILAKDYGSEVMGNHRVPLFTMEDRFRGFPSFLANLFAGNSREQLLYTLVHLGIMSQEEIDKALKAKRKSNVIPW